MLNRCRNTYQHPCIREDPFENDWERFAYRDYQQLALDEEECDDREMSGACIDGNSGGSQHVYDNGDVDSMVEVDVDVGSEDIELDGDSWDHYGEKSMSITG